METFYLVLVIFIFVIAIFGLWAGVSNDAVNFLNSAIGSKAGSLKMVMGVAAIGIFAGAAMSNGMIEVAQNGVYQPQHFYLRELMCILLAIMLANVILIDIFNSLGLPTSTTVSLVFAMLGGTFVMAMVKVFNSPETYSMGQLINTEKALQMIVAIFASVAIAFIFGTLVQYLARIIFKFNYTNQMKYFGAIFCGFAVTAIVYFILFKGLKDSSLMTPEKKLWIEKNTQILMIGCFVGATVLMQFLSMLKVNILKIVVLLGTFALALAFAGNDLVNFIGVPLVSLFSYQDFVANGVSPDTFLMTNINPDINPEASGAANQVFLFIAGAIMVLALVTSKKAHNVIKTSLNLSRQDSGEEGFGTSPIARRLVRMTTNSSNYISNAIPAGARNWINSRFDKDEAIMENGAAFDLIRAAVNLVLASLLIALGTSLKLPLSTTYVTFMVAMGSSLADRAWGRESAVYRITGVISVVGGWFITAGAAFLICALLTAIIYFGGTVAIIASGLFTAYLLIRSELSYKKKAEKEKESTVAQDMANNTDKQLALPLLRQFSREEFAKVLGWGADLYNRVSTGFLKESYRTLRKASGDIEIERLYFKQVKRMGTIGVSKLTDQEGLEKGLYYFHGNDFAYDIVHAIKRTCDPCLEHTDNNFNPLNAQQRKDFELIAQSIVAFLKKGQQAIEKNSYDELPALYNEGNHLINQLGVIKREEIRHMREQVANVKVEIVYLTIIQESQNVVAYTINLLKMNRKLQDENA